MVRIFTNPITDDSREATEAETARYKELDPLFWTSDWTFEIVTAVIRYSQRKNKKDRRFIEYIASNLDIAPEDVIFWGLAYEL